MRVKFHDLVPSAGKTPYANVYYFTGIDRWEGVAEDYGIASEEKLYKMQAYSFNAAEVAAFNSGEYVTITFPVAGLSSDSHTLLTNLRFQIGNVENKVSTIMGGFAIDYVYVGPAYSAPENLPLYFDFGGTGEDINHYGTHNYLSQNFDANNSSGTAVAWRSTTSARMKSFVVNHTDSTLDITSKLLDDTTAPNFTIATNLNLCYNPRNAEVFEIRFKFNNYKRGEYTTSSGSVSKPANSFNLAYIDSKNTTWVENVLSTKFPETILNSNEYVTYQLELGDNFRNAVNINSLRMQFTGLESISDSNLGVLSIDYIYIGSMADAPSMSKADDHLLYDFGAEDKSTWTYVNNTGTTVTRDSAYGTIEGTVTARDPYVGIPFTKATDNYVLKADDVVIVRLKVDSGLGSGLQAFFAVKGSQSYAQPSAYYTAVADFTPDGKYQTIVLKPNDNVVGKTIMGLRVDIVNNYTTGATGKYEIDYVYLGSNISADATNHLYFDFKNSAADQVRYATEASYGGKNYDIGNWRTQFYYNSTTTDVTHTFNNIDGTISCEVTDQAAAVKFMAQNLSFNPKNAEVVRVRFKIENMRAKANATNSPFVRLWYNGEYNTDTYQFGKTYISNSNYLTIETNLDSALRATASITQLNITFHELVLNDTTKNGKITIDYIYVGPKTIQPYVEDSADYFYLDFKNTAADQARYTNDPVYGGRNYDLASNWYYNRSYTSAPLMDYTKGTMTLGYIDATRTGMWYHINPNSSTFQMKFRPGNNAYVQIRLRFNNMVASGTAKARIAYFIGPDIYEGTGVTTKEYPYWLDSYMLTDDEISSDEFVTLTFPVVRTNNIVHSTWTNLRFTLEGIKSSDSALGTVEVDYIYIGRSEDFEKLRADTNSQWQTVTDGTTADNQQSNHINSMSKALLFDFGNTPGDRVRYSATQYGGNSFDVSSAWGTSRSHRVNSFIINPNNSTLDLALKDSQASFTFCSKTALNYDPSNAEIFEIRFKLKNMEQYNSNQPFIDLYYKGDNATEWTAACTNNFYPVEYLWNEKYITVRMNRENFTDAFKAAKTLTTFDCYFGWSRTGISGVASIDYIYFGPKSSAPSGITYGYDSSYTNDSKLSNSSSRFTEGRGIPLMNSNNSINYSTPFSETAFTFTGTGFDLISRTGENQSAIRAAVYDSNGYCVKIAQVVNKSDLGTELMQIPVLSIENLKHDTYYVKISVAAPFDYDDSIIDLGGALDRGGEFYFDAVRIYGTINTASSATNAANAYKLYQKHGEADPCYEELRNKLIDTGNFTADGKMSGVVYLDASAKLGVNFDNENGKLKPEVAEYKAIGPNNEVYLAPGNAVAFKLEITGVLPASIDIGAKSADGTSVSMNVSVATAAPSSIATGTVQTIASSTALYYPLPINTSMWKLNGESYYTYVTIHNNGTSGILSLTDIKFAYDVANSAAQKSIRFVIDSEMIRALTNPCDHVYTYTDNGATHTIGCASCDYSATDAHAYIDGTCICSARQTYVLDEALDFNMSVSIGAEMQVIYMVMASKVNSFERIYLEVSKNVAGAEPVVTTYGLDADMNELQALTNDEGKISAYRATYTGINAKEMGDDFTATLYAVAADGTIHYSNASTSSIKSFLMDKLADEKSVAELKTLAVDMLNYAAAAQRNFNYDTEHLVNADLTDEQKALGTQTTPEAVDSANISGDGLDLIAGVSVKSKVELNLTCMYKTADISTVKFVIKDTEGNILAELAPTNFIANKAVQCVYDNVGAKQMRQLITVEVHDGDTLVSKTLTWSIESYVASTLATTTNGILSNMVNAMLIYGDSAAEYLALRTQ